MPKNLLNKVIAECIGTFALVFAGCGAIMVHGIDPAAVPLHAIPLAFGLVIMVMIYALGHISGAHFNPAVTLAFAMIGRFKWSEVLPYWLGQCAGAIAAMVVLSSSFQEPLTLGVTTPHVAIEIAVFWEVLLTFILMFVIISVATDSRAVGMMAGAAIGGTVMLDALIGGPVTGASMNPARSLAPAIVSGDLAHLWIYLVAPPLGAIIAAFTYEKIRCENKTESSNSAKGCC